MVNVRKNAMREYHNLVHQKKDMDFEPKKYSSRFCYMSDEAWKKREQRYESICDQIELLKKVLELK
ncbi:MAG: hypothetical protein IKW21_00455 [Lachnospiraceae bacterium]|nr:hypothetical protein [Lachnospiraceae bacterium]